jgi:hypothetical protein
MSEQRNDVQSDEAEQASDESEMTADERLALDGRRRLGKRLILAALAIVVIAQIATYVSRQRTAATGSEVQTYIGVSGADEADYIQVNARILEVQPVAGTQQVRLTVTPHGSFANRDGSLNQTINLDADGYLGGSINLTGGEIPPPVQLVLDLEGDLSQYPFDSYSSALQVRLTRVVRNSDGTGTSKSDEPVPMRLAVSAKQHDWAIASSHAETWEDGAISATVGARRGGAMRAFALFELAVMIALACIAVAMTYTTLITGRPLEFSMFVWLGAMLFALPAVRNTMPGVPGVGTVLDYAGFFWCLIAVAACLITAAITYIRTAFRASHSKS